MGASFSGHRQSLRDRGAIFQFADPDLLTHLEAAVLECNLEETAAHLKALQTEAAEPFVVPDPNLIGKTDGE